MSFVKGGQLCKWIFAYDIRVQDEERAVILPKNLLREFQGAGGAEWFLFDGECDVDSERLLVLLTYALSMVLPVEEQFDVLQTDASP